MTRVRRLRRIGETQQLTTDAARGRVGARLRLPDDLFEAVASACDGVPAVLDAAAAEIADHIGPDLASPDVALHAALRARYLAISRYHLLAWRSARDDATAEVHIELAEVARAAGKIEDAYRLACAVVASGIGAARANFVVARCELFVRHVAARPNLRRHSADRRTDRQRSRAR